MLTIRPANAEECEFLSCLAVEDRAHWSVDAEQLQALRASLEIDPRLLRRRPTFVVDLETEVVGFYQLRFDVRPPRFERFWVRPSRASLGVGALMWDHARELAKSRGVGGLRLAGSSAADRLRGELLRATNGRLEASPERLPEVDKRDPSVPRKK